MKNAYLPLFVFQAISFFSLSCIQTSQLGSRELYGMNKSHKLKIPSGKSYISGLQS